MKPLIKSISYDQDEILHAICELHTGPIDCDVTYGSGCFYKRMPRPNLCFDIAPRQDHVVGADVRDIPLPDNTVSCVAFDPPFMARTAPGSVLKHRFGEIGGTIEDLWLFYQMAMTEIYRVLKKGGHLIFKCQDGVLSGVNNFTHIPIYNTALEIGFVGVDLFILLAKNRMWFPQHPRQVHARKYHSYFWVFKKK